ncbi:hypothetical protein OIU77_016478 [Salix suchowensis]|uniref:Uncharacterized protein n=1 Tax=Salix suchowensis TaxID=1278906 RepID=A0ABQ8ZKI6_9ROSI|nr:hypothetical protein OIU77_016478 [Salix suchowensis]
MPSNSAITCDSGTVGWGVLVVLPDPTRRIDRCLKGYGYNQGGHHQKSVPSITWSVSSELKPEELVAVLEWFLWIVELISSHLLPETTYVVSLFYLKNDCLPLFI